jgi:ferredoxin
MRIEIDPIKCEAHGLCAELLPERITLDEWGYPLIDGAPVPRSLEDLARRAASACPTLALRLRASEGIDLDGAISSSGRRLEPGAVERGSRFEAARARSAAARATDGRTQPHQPKRPKR